MAKHIKALSRTTRQAKKAAATQVVKPVNPKSPKGKPAREQAKKRASRKAIAGKRPELLAAKQVTGPVVKRERKAVYAEYLFAAMTPRQVKHLEKRPKQIEELRQAIAAKVLAKQTAEKTRVDELRAAKARAKARAAKNKVR